MKFRVKLFDGECGVLAKRQASHEYNTLCQKGIMSWSIKGYIIFSDCINNVFHY